MDVQQIYDQHLIPPNLQKHMLRVAALSSILTENWNKEKFDKESVVIACLFHDMANIIKFNFDKPALFKEEENQIDYWKKIQSEMIQKYGRDVHLATLKICREIDLSKKVLGIIEKMKWENALDLLKLQYFESAILIYCDMRIGPFGIMPLKDRIDDLSTRNQNYDFNSLKAAAELLESTLQKNISIDVDEVSDVQLSNRFSELLNLKV